MLGYTAAEVMKHYIRKDGTLTALAMKGDKERIRAGCDGYIAKPMRYRDFLAAIEARLART
jgi:two-component system cell cycle response regulator DivK